MPLLDENAGTIATSANITDLGLSEHDNPSPDYLDTLGAAMRQENLIGSIAASHVANLSSRDFYRIEPGYDPYDGHISGYEDYADRFENATNPQATSAIKLDIDQEKRDREILAASGWVGTVFSMGAGFGDPTILVPGGALVKTGRVGYSVGRSALVVGAAAGAGVAVQEAGLQATQQTRTVGESAINIGGTIALGSFIGAAGSRILSGSDWMKFGAKLEEELAEDTANPSGVAEAIVDRMKASGGAAAAPEIKIDDLGVGGPQVARAIAKATEFVKINPGVQTMMSPSVKVREIYNKMVDNPIYTTMNMRGETVGPSVENLVKQYQRGSLAKWIKSSRQFYRQAKKSGFEGTRDDFLVRVARAGRRGDVDELGNEFVTQAARQARDEIFDPLLKRAIEGGLLPEDVKVTTAASYVTRLWNRTRLIAEEDRFRAIADEYFRKAIASIPEKDRPDFVSKADLDGYVEEVTTAVYNQLLGKGDPELPEWIVPVKRGPLKERTFGIADSLVEDFLENDAELILRRYSRTMAAEVELADKFGRADLKDQIAEIRQDYQNLRKQAKTEKERVKLDKAEKRDIDNLTAFRDLIRGTYRAAEESSDWSKLTRLALAWNYVRLLGGVTLTSIADTMRLIGVHGVQATMREALPALVSNLKAAKISRQDARDLGAVVETVLQSRIATLAELHDPYRYGSAFDKYLSNATNIFSKATGLAYWNDGMKQIASVMTQNRMARNALNWSKAGQREKSYMAYLGINENMAGRISEQLNKHGVQEKGIWGANVSKWDDVEAARTWGAALNKDVDRTIITKGVSDQPLWTRTNWGRIIMQFKSFGLASHQRVLIAGLQERPHRFAEQMVFGSAMGMMIAWLKMIERGDTERADRLVENPGMWIADGLDRTGLLSLPFEISNTADKVSASYGGPNIGFTALAGALAGDEDRSGGVSRYASRNALGAVMGPSAGMFEDLANISVGLARATGAAEGDVTQSQINAAVRQIPGATLPGIRPAIHVGLKPALEDALR